MLVIGLQGLESDVSRMESCRRLTMWRYTTPTYRMKNSMPKQYNLPYTKPEILRIFNLVGCTGYSGERRLVAITEYEQLSEP